MLAGTRLDISATGEVTRVPDLAIISAGVVTRCSRPRPRAIAGECGPDGAGPRGAEARRDRGPDIQTSSINLNPEYRYVENQPPQLTGYRASNTGQRPVPRHPQAPGEILDALVAEGANQINGPT